MTGNDRPQPHDDNAEQALLGAMLTIPDTVATVETILSLGDFYTPIHTAIHHAITARASRNQPLDEILIAQDLAKTGQLTKLPGGAAYLHTCITACPDPSHATHYAHIVADHAAARRLLHLAEDLTKAAYIDDPTRRADLFAVARAQLDTILAAPADRANGTRLRLTPADQFQIKPVRWAWADRMPIGEITLIPGREGVGKSTFLAWMAAAITLGNLPGQYHGKPAAVLYAASEDAWDYTIAPRMLAAGADLRHVYRIDAVQDDGPTRLTLPRDCAAIPTHAAKVGAVALMCDPLMSLLDDRISTFRAQELRTALEPLRRAAEDANMVVPALVHFNKSQGGDINTLIAGSRAFTEVARAVVAIAQDKDADNYTCVVSQTKNNLGRLDLPSLAYTIESVTLETDEDEPARVGRLKWLGEVEYTAEDILSGDAGDRGLSDNTMAVLDYVDANGPISGREVVEHFDGRIKAATVRQILSRSAKRGDVVTQARGMYLPPKSVSDTRKTRVSQTSSTTPYTPPVTTSHTHINAASSSSKGVTRGVTRGVTSDTIKSVSDSSDSSDTVTGYARAREEEINKPVWCYICYSPLNNPDGTGRHPTCEPGEDEPEREWYP